MLSSTALNTGLHLHQSQGSFLLFSYSHLISASGVADQKKEERHGSVVKAYKMENMEAFLASLCPASL